MPSLIEVYFIKQVSRKCSTPNRQTYILAHNIKSSNVFYLYRNKGGGITWEGNLVVYSYKHASTVIANKQFGCGCRFKSNCPLVGPETINRMSSIVLFLRGPNAYLSEFRRKPRETPYG